jgi:hypothetical protein
MTTSPASEDALSELEQRMVATLIADAAEQGTDLNDPQARADFRAGLAVSLAWITAAHDTGKITPASFRVLNEMLSVSISALDDAE